MINLPRLWLWMLRSLLLWLFLAISVSALPLNREYTLLAGKIQSEPHGVLAQEDVLIYSKSYAFRADKAYYAPHSGDLELFGNVDIMMEGKILNRLNHTVFNLKTKTFKSDKLFAYDATSHMWFNTQNVEGKENQLQLKKTTISSCNRIDPDWKIKFSTGVYNKDKEYISIYNPTFYAGNVPILYLPWFGFSTNKARKTGFLKPILGFENSENLFFVLPYYIASEKNWDLELDPQIRLNRGVGLYSTFRFVDTNHSKVTLNIGIFDEKKSYFDAHNLENRTHYGIDFKYETTELLTKGSKEGSFHDGLLADITYLNDIDYLNLDHKRGWASSKLVTSRANYVYYSDKDFIGAYAKYFIDTEKKSNATTLQTLPSIQYHRFSQNSLFPNVLYSLDYKFKNNYRKVGLNAKQHEISIPVIFHKSLWGDYLNFKASENFYYSRVNYTEGNETTQNADYFSNYHQLSISSDLSKQYPTYIHNMQLELSMSIPSFEHKKGYFADFLPFNLETKSLSFKVNQYYYNLDGFNFLMHRIRQTLYDDESIYKYSDLENQVIYRFSKDFVLHNTLFYSHKYDRIKKLQTGVRYKDAKYNIGVNHTYEYKPIENNTNFITTRFESKVSGKYALFGSWDYDFKQSFTKEWTLGWHMKKRCWDYRFRYKESVTPSLTSAGTESLVKRGILLFVRFSPFGGMAYNFSHESKLDLEHREGVE